MSPISDDYASRDASTISDSLDGISRSVDELDETLQGLLEVLQSPSCSRNHLWRQLQMKEGTRAIDAFARTLQGSPPSVSNIGVYFYCARCLQFTAYSQDEIVTRAKASRDVKPVSAESEQELPK